MTWPGPKDEAKRTAYKIGMDLMEFDDRGEDDEDTEFFAESLGGALEPSEAFKAKHDLLPEDEFEDLHGACMVEAFKSHKLKLEISVRDAMALSRAPAFDALFYEVMEAAPNCLAVGYVVFGVASLLQNHAHEIDHYGPSRGKIEKVLQYQGFGDGLPTKKPTLQKAWSTYRSVAHFSAALIHLHSMHTENGLRYAKDLVKAGAGNAEELEDLILHDVGEVNDWRSLCREPGVFLALARHYENFIETASKHEQGNEKIFSHEVWSIDPDLNLPDVDFDVPPLSKEVMEIILNKANPA